MMGFFGDLFEHASFCCAYGCTTKIRPPAVMCNECWQRAPAPNRNEIADVIADLIAATREQDSARMLRLGRRLRVAKRNAANAIGSKQAQ